MMMDETIKRAIEELNDEGLLDGLKITEIGKQEVERILREDKNCRNIVFMTFWRKIEADFFEDEPLNFCLKVLKLEKLLKKSNIDLSEELEKFK